MTDLIRAAIRNDWSGARRLNRKFFSLMQAHFTEPSPAPIKAVLTLLGRGAETMRLPMVPVTSATRHKLETLLGELGLLVHTPAAHQDNLRVF